jgi:uncharacterized membrane protein
MTAAGAALATLMPVAAHQLRLCDHLPDPPGGLFASDTIVDSTAAHPLGLPDGLLGVGSYTVTLVLLLAARRFCVAQPLLRIKLSADASAATINVVRQIVTFRRLCSWCMATAAATAVMVHYGRRSVT